MSLTMTRKNETPMPPPTTSLDRLREAVEKSGKTLAQIAKASGIEASTISRILSGERRLRAEHLESIGPVVGLKAPVEASVSRLAAVQPEMPEGLAHYLEGREEMIAPAVVKAMKGSQFQTIPGVTFDDAFWDDQRQLWEKRLGLRPLDNRGAGAGGGKSAP